MVVGFKGVKTSFWVKWGLYEGTSSSTDSETTTDLYPSEETRGTLTLHWPSKVWTSKPRRTGVVTRRWGRRSVTVIPMTTEERRTREGRWGWKAAKVVVQE